MAYGKWDPEPGDLIQVKRGVYEHWALYLGDGYVVHVTSEDEGVPPLSAGSEVLLTKKVKVKKQLLKDVVGNDDWEVNNKYDRSRTPFPVKEIIKRAESYIDREVIYDVLIKNCEHFVTMLRYGKGVSDQARKAIAGILTGGAVVVASIASAVSVSLRHKSGSTPPGVTGRQEEFRSWQGAWSRGGSLSSFGHNYY